MGYSRPRLGVALSASAVASVLLVALVVMSQVSMALLPVLGIGGFYLQADTFLGNNGQIYPQKGQDVPTPLGASHGVTDTARCRERPMLVIDLESADVTGFKVFKDVELPFTNRWLSIQMDQPSGQISGSELRIFTTQAWMDQLVMDNIQLKEAESSATWGPSSGEFIMRGDPGGRGDPTHPNPDLEATNAKMWVHAVTGDGVSFTGSPIRLELSYPTSTDLANRYSGEGVLAANGRSRDTYFDCLPP